MSVLEFTDWKVYSNFHIFYLISQVSYSASERKSKYYETQTPILLKNTYFVTEILIKEENYFLFHFIFVFSYIFVIMFHFLKIERIVLI